MSGKAVGRTAAALPWLCPNTDSLIRLAEAPAGFARPCDADPALLAFLLRFATPAQPGHPALFCAASLPSAVLPDAAAAYLAHSSTGFVPPGCEVTRRCRALTARAAPLARRLAEHTRRACPERAFAVAGLAPLGWLAVAAVDHSIAAEALHDPESPPVPTVQAAVWGLDQNAIARRLANWWRLPDWIATILGNLSLPLHAAKRVVADVDLFAVAQLAILETERRTRPLGLTENADRLAVLAALGLDASAVDELWAALPTPADAPAPALDPNPHKVPLVNNLLRMAAESRRRNGTAHVARLEDRLDQVHAAVAGVGGETEQPRPGRQTHRAGRTRRRRRARNQQPAGGHQWQRTAPVPDRAGTRARGSTSDDHPAVAADRGHRPRPHAVRPAPAPDPAPRRGPRTAHRGA